MPYSSSPSPRKAKMTRPLLIHFNKIVLVRLIHTVGGGGVKGSSSNCHETNNQLKKQGVGVVISQHQQKREIYPKPNPVFLSHVIFSLRLLLLVTDSLTRAPDQHPALSRTTGTHTQAYFLTTPAGNGIKKTHTHKRGIAKQTIYTRPLALSCVQKRLRRNLSYGIFCLFARCCHHRDGRGLLTCCTPNSELRDR